MRKAREVLRLTFGEGLSRRRVAAATGVPYSTIADCLARAAAAGLGWPLPERIDDTELERRLYPGPSVVVGSRRPEPEWARVHADLRRKGVTLQLLWIEYKQRVPDGYQYTQFVHRYRQWAGRLDVVLRQEHRAGEKLFLDFSGQTLPITDPMTGVVTPAEVFLSVLGASNLTYAEALPSQELPHWIAANVHALEFIGAVPEILVPDNLRSAVTKAHRYEPLLNATYQEMAAHYGCVIIPARSGKPRDKAKVEAGVLLAQRWILASLRNRIFFSIAEANVAIRERLQWLNDRPFQKLDGSRRTLFELLEKPAMRALPPRPYEYATWKTATVNIDYHVEVDRHYYSVPYQLARQRCDVRLTASTTEAFFKGRRVASHRRSFKRGSHTTLPEHMPESHRRHLEWTPSRIVRWAQNSGPNTVALVDEIMRSRPHPEQGYRSCLGILRLGKRYGGDRLDAACARAVAIRAFSYRSVESILSTGLDRQPLLPIAAVTTTTTPRAHDHVRGPGYYE
jgi:transposase